MAKTRTGSDDRLREYRRKRDFEKTAEPAGSEGAAAAPTGLRFVVQKHAASHLHYDLRLEMEGVMRSWAVPKGPSLDPAVRRLAMEVEDHPIDYNDFEGTIPAGEYGGGTVMLWDRGTYIPDERKRNENVEKAALRGYRAGKLSITFRGERLQGSFTLVRTDTVEGGVRSKWLLIKQDDEHADSETDITEQIDTSVSSGRSMEEIAAGKGGKRVWRSNRGKDAAPEHKSRKQAAADVPSYKPMLARAGISVPKSAEGWTFEPKYDGIRVLAFSTPDRVALITRNGHDKSRQFPEIVEALRALVQDLGESLVLDGEVVARRNGEIARFEELQGRMHVQDARRIRSLAQKGPAALAVFDLLLRGARAVVRAPWAERRAELEDTLGGRETSEIFLAPTTTDRAALTRQAEKEGWEGLIAKRIDGRYQPGRRSDDWVKLKMENRQELVVGGWTDPRKSRAFFGAILLGYYDDSGELIYAGHTGTGFSREQLQDIYKQLRRLERKTPPFNEKPKTNEPAHWTTPKLVVEVKFNEWTKEGKLRQPVFLGIRTDKDPREVVREPLMGETASDPTRKAKTTSRTAAALSHEQLDNPVAARLRDLRQTRAEGELETGPGEAIGVTSLEKTFHPETGHTKGDLLLYYARMAEHILPWMKDRPLVLKRFPNGVEGESFYQQAAPDSVPNGVRVETLTIEGKKQRRLVGGNLSTLLYTIQLGAISYDPWHSRVQHLDTADYTILDLDPGPGTDFGTVVKVARWVREEMDELGLHGALKTSGSSGLHVYLPLPPGTPLDAATLVAQIVATKVAQRHPEFATIERMTKKRPKGTIYVDYLQNILGKTVAGVYAARAKDRPMVATPLRWEELTDELDFREFTIDTVPSRLVEVGELWAPAMAEPNSLEGLLARAG